MKPTVEKFEPYEAGPREWGQELIVAQTEQYLGKMLTMRNGHRGGLQYHRRHDETMYVLSGRLLVEYDPGDGTLAQVIVNPGDSYHIPCGAVHRATALEDTVYFETGTPPLNDRVRVEAQYGEVQEGGLPTTA